MTMRFAKALLFLLLVPLAGVSIAADVELRITRQGASTVSHDQALLGDVIALVESCSVDSTSYAVKAQTWQDSMQEDSFVHVKFPSPRKLNFKASLSGLQAVDEILAPLPKEKSPAHILVKNENGVHSLAKYGPRELERLRKDLDANNRKWEAR